MVAEVALALVLLVSAGLLLRSFERLFSVAPGFDASHVLTMQVQTNGRRFDDDNVNRQFFAQALEAVRQVPGVAAAAIHQPVAAERRSIRRIWSALRIRAMRGKQAGNESLFRYAVSPGYSRGDGYSAAARAFARCARYAGRAAWRW